MARVRGGGTTSQSNELEKLNSEDKDKLRNFVKRMENLAEEKAEVVTAEKEVLDEAKAAGFTPKMIRKVLAIRKQDPEKRAHDEAVLDLYLRAMGMRYDD